MSLSVRVYLRVRDCACLRVRACGHACVEGSVCVRLCVRVCAIMIHMCHNTYVRTFVRRCKIQVYAWYYVYDTRVFVVHA